MAGWELAALFNYVKSERKHTVSKQEIRDGWSMAPTNNTLGNPVNPLMTIYVQSMVENKGELCRGLKKEACCRSPLKRFVDSFHMTFSEFPAVYAREKERERQKQTDRQRISIKSKFLLEKQ